jgi:hypothetical protein
MILLFLLMHKVSLPTRADYGRKLILAERAIINYYVLKKIIWPTTTSDLILQSFFFFFFKLYMQQSEC